MSGGDLTRRAVAQAKRFGVEILAAEAGKICVENTYRCIELTNGSEISCHSLLIATGVQWRKMEAPGIERLTGAGIYYGAAMTEAMSCKNEDVYIIGGANSAGQAAMYCSRYARQVVMLVRGASLNASMSKYLIDQIKQTENIRVEYNSSVIEAHGDKHLEAISVHCTESNETNVYPANSLFILIGAMPHTDWLEGVIERDKHGFILTGTDLLRDGKPPRGWTADRAPELLETNVPGIFAVGDVRSGSVKRVASASAKVRSRFPSFINI